MGDSTDLFLGVPKQGLSELELVASRQQQRFGPTVNASVARLLVVELGLKSIQALLSGVGFFEIAQDLAEAAFSRTMNRNMTPERGADRMAFQSFACSVIRLES